LAEVRLQEGESLENALRRFKRKVQQEDIIKEVKRHSFYLKPGEKKRVKAALARKRARKRRARNRTRALKGRPFPGRPCSVWPPPRPSCNTGSFILIVHPAFKHEKLYPRTVLGAWRAESKGQFEGGTQPVFSLYHRLPREWREKTG